jgi:hypothetical protein
LLFWRDEAAGQCLQGRCAYAGQRKQGHDGKYLPVLFGHGHDGQCAAGAQQAGQYGAPFAEQAGGVAGQQRLRQCLADAESTERHADAQRIPVEGILSPQGPAGAIGFAGRTEGEKHQRDRH